MKKSLVMRLVKDCESKGKSFIIILNNGYQTPPMRFIDEDSESLVVEHVSDSSLAAFNYDDIRTLSAISSSVPMMMSDLKRESQIDIKVESPVETVIPSSENVADFLEKAKRVIWLHSFSFMERHDQIREAIRSTPLAKEWDRTQNIISDAQKNHVLLEKIKDVINILKHLPLEYDCIELYLMMGEAYALSEDFDNASYQYEIAGDYQNAAYYAAKCEDHGNKYLIEIFRKWVLSENNCGKDILASFIALAHSLHCGRICAETVKKINYQELSDEEKNILFLGLILVLTNYLPNEKIQITSEPIVQKISTLLEQLIAESQAEVYEPEGIKMLKHASELTYVSSNIPNTWEDGIQIGYIIKILEGHGYIGKTKTDTLGICFQNFNVTSEELLAVIESNPTAARGLKVVYRLSQNSQNKDHALEVQPAENLEEFLTKKSINMPIKICRSSAKEMLALNPGGKTYCGYIIKYHKYNGFGFIHKDKNAEIGIYFHISALEERLKEVADRIKWLKVSCELTESEVKEGEIQAVNITADEDLELFLENHQENVSSSVENEVVDEYEIRYILKVKKTPSAALQHFATTNRPLHALAVLERSRDSFSYDKYVKHKIQLLQRTKSSDNELIQLLNYTINASHDGSYIAHNLYFLGQVQYRCRQYTDVIGTMKRLQNYVTYMKTPTQKTDFFYLTAVAYYMIRDYTNAEYWVKQLQKSGAHTEEVEKILNRTFAPEASISDSMDEAEIESSLQFDTEVKITPYMEKRIDRFSFGLISVKDIPSNFDPWSGECTISRANDYIERIIRYDKKREQKNNPNAAIAIAKIKKWLLHQSPEEKKDEIEKSLRDNVSRALQIIARSTMQQSGLDIRVHLFYRMQQYEMSIREEKANLLNAYVNAHYGSLDMNSLHPAKNGQLKGNQYLLMISNLLLLFSYMEDNEFADEKTKIEHLFRILESRPADGDRYRKALYAILDRLQEQYNKSEELYNLLTKGTKAIKHWLDSRKKDIRRKAESKQWDELANVLDSLNTLENTSFLTEYEMEYVRRIQKVVKLIDSTDQNAQIATKQYLLEQSKNDLGKLEDDLDKHPTFILYNLFADALSILKNSTLYMLADVMSHEPNIESAGSLQINLGLTDSREFILPLEFQNRAPAMQAKNLTLSVKEISQGVSLQSALPIGQNVDEGKKYSQSLTFRLDNPNIHQVDISIIVEYSYDVFDNHLDERRTVTRSFNYTITFQQVEKIKNKYRDYAQSQTVRDKTMFFGRDALIQKLYDAVSMQNAEGKDILKGGNGIVLYGQRRSGKTSILYHLQEKIQNEMQNTLVIDLGSCALQISDDNAGDELTEQEIQELNANMTLHTLYYSIISGIRRAVRNDNSQAVTALAEKISDYEEKNHTSLFPTTAEFMNAVNPQLLFNDFLEQFSFISGTMGMQYEVRVVIFIDEFTYFNKAIQLKKLPGNFMEIWKGIVSGSFITLIVAGQDNMVEFIDGYVNEFSSFQREWVTFLEKDASYKMVTNPIGKERIELESAEKLYRFTAGSPFLLMDVCAELVDWMNENKILKLAGSLLDDFLAGKYMQSFKFKEILLEPQYKDAGRLDWTEDIKLVLGLIARNTSKKVNPSIVPWDEFDQYVLINEDMLENRGINAEKMHEILERLVKRQVLETKEGYQNYFRIKIPLCREWILRRGGLEYGNE